MGPNPLLPFSPLSLHPKKKKKQLTRAFGARALTWPHTHTHTPLGSARESARERALKPEQPPLCSATALNRPVCVGRSASATHTQYSQPQSHAHTARDEKKNVKEKRLIKARHKVERLRIRQLSSGAATPKRAPQREPHTHTHTHTRLVDQNKTSARLSATKLGLAS